jgi:hypothetical protein
MENPMKLNPMKLAVALLPTTLLVGSMGAALANPADLQSDSDRGIVQFEKLPFGSDARVTADNLLQQAQEDQFINDLYQSSGKDRNLYVHSVDFNDKHIVSNTTLHSNGFATINVNSTESSNSGSSSANPGTRTPNGTLALRAKDFLDTLGVNIHMGSSSTPYANVNATINALKYLGFDNVRDAAVNAGKLIPLGKAGIDLDVLVGGWDGPLDKQLDRLKQIAPYTKFVEGPNEIDRRAVTYDGKTGPSAAVEQSEAIYDFVHRNLPDADVIGFSVTGTKPSNFAPYGTGQKADYGNAHVYFGSGTPPAADIDKYGKMPGMMTPGKDVVLTETGFPTSTTGNQHISDIAQAKNTLNVVLDAAKQGFARLYLYELVDERPKPTDQEANYGLFNNDWSPKASATALHNLTTILEDNSSNAEVFKTGKLNYSISGLPSSDNSLLEKANGVFDLAIWAEHKIYDGNSNKDLPAPTSKVMVNLGQIFDTVKVYDPLAGANAINTYDDISSIQVNVTDHPIIIEMIGGAAMKNIAARGAPKAQGLTAAPNAKPSS